MDSVRLGRIGLCCAAGFLAACSPSLPPSPPPYPRVAVTSAIDEVVAQWMLEYRDELGPPEFDLVPLPFSQASEGTGSGEFALLISVAPPETDWFRTPLAAEGVTVIVHADNPVLDLSLEDLRRVFSGGIANWSELGGEDVPVQPYIPYPGDDLRTLFETRLMAGSRLSSGAFLVPHSRAAREALGQDRGGVGMIPSSMVDESVRALRIEGFLPGPSTIEDGRYAILLTILASAPLEPSGAIRDWLGWLQEPGRLSEP